MLFPTGLESELTVIKSCYEGGWSNPAAFLLLSVALSSSTYD